MGKHLLKLTEAQVRALCEVSAPKLNATALRDFACPRCGGKISKGERLYMYRERATSFGEARDRGTLYPWRKRCRMCSEAAALEALEDGGR